ncbi:dihydrofolate synthase/folylpolyglutamate synthase [Hydromonas duriensis]|uniref:Dihydrofolate synthase/folylpolyglutamate synthase n=1 Tax=Hydromonas duriensis TaxID=1527608 RepID=A0A4R6Y6I7_9BURK|nr:folylpolyglutamate synthase/dihydrofolate synthase family protein [Hydromonas duriensis]TDR31072.1 dihydrofolate synthase/folylpolyglutamate synthase [Hydromonas duriensis]
MNSLQKWLTHLETAHSSAIDLGLERVRTVKERLQASGDLRLNYPVITVGGTNGKGSTCAFLENILLAAGYKVGCHTSPHILHFNERARWGGVDATDSQLLPFFERVEAARCQLDVISLSYFEFTLLAIMCWFDAQKPDVVVLEVGLGGRLDASNVFDASCSVVTNVDIDHVGYLGDTREAIGFEKAGIFRAGRPAICADTSPPTALVAHAQAIGADLKLLGKDFEFTVVQDEQRKQWRFVGEHTRRNSLAMPAMRGDYQLMNASAALAALDALYDVLPVSQQAVRQGLAHAVVRARFQVLPGQPLTVLDVAHNPHAARVLAKNLGQLGYAPYTHAVFGAMADKDIVEVLRIMRPHIDRWHLCALPNIRAAGTEQLHDALIESGFVEDKDHSVHKHESVKDALTHLATAVPADDRIIIFGSFVTIEQALIGMPRLN